MKNYQTEFLSQYISNLRISRNLSRLAYQAGNALYLNNQCVLQSREGEHFAYTVEDNYQDFYTDIFFDDNSKKVEMQCNCNAEGICSHKVSALLQLHEDLSQEIDQKLNVGMKYTREGMIKRVMAEREEKARNEKYQLDFADNIYGEHVISNQQNRTYKLTFYDFDNRQGYCSCPDHHTNKLGTCKHLIYAFNAFQNEHADKIIPVQNFPFLEVFLHPLKEYRISWFYLGKLPFKIQELVDAYFDGEQQVSNKKLLEFQGFIREAQKHKFIKIRPEVLSKIDKSVEKQSIADLKAKTTLNFDGLDIKLYPFQKEGVEFLVFSKGAILADEVGLGKTLQAIIAAQFKKELFNLHSVLIVCPDSLIQHWEQEIQKAGGKSCLVINGAKDTNSSKIQKHWDYRAEAYFNIIGFDDFARQSSAIDGFAPDMLIIDEAQKISNFDSDLVGIIRKIKRKHLLIITDSKPANQLMQFYTMVGLIDNTALTPLWEFSYQHCLFDSQVLDKITGYFNQENIEQRIPSLLLRREKDDVIDQLQKINRLIVPVNFSGLRQAQHQKLVAEALFLLDKKLKTKFGWQNLAQLLMQMKSMASLVFESKPTQSSAKFVEFKHFLQEKINFATESKKIIVFAEEEERRKQLHRFFKECKVLSETVNQGLSEKEKEAVFERFEQHKGTSVLLIKEGSYEQLPDSEVLIYFDLSLNRQAMDKRLAYLQQQSAAQPPLLVHFLSHDSIEYGMYQILQEKGDLFDEITNFMILKNEDAELSREAQNKLKSILQGLLIENSQELRKKDSGQTLLFPLNDEYQSISLSGEEHKAFEKPEIHQSKPSVDMKKLLDDAHSFLSSLYAVQTGEELPWKAEDIDLKMNEEEIVLRIKRK